MGYHRILRIVVSTESIELECPACCVEMDVRPSDSDVKCDFCETVYGVVWTDGVASLDGSADDDDEGDWQPPPKLYHGTSLRRFKEMLASPKSFELYLADNIDGAGMYAETASAEDESSPVTIVFDTDKLASSPATGQLWPDWDDVDTMITGEDTDADGSPLFGDAASARDVSWTDSLRVINTCSYEGDFSGAIIEVLLDDGEVAKPPFGKLSAQTPPAKLYHGTFGWNSGTISEDGIVPGHANWDLSDPQYVYLTETPELAANWVREAYEGGDAELDWDRAETAVFEVNTAALSVPVEHDPKGGCADWRHKGAVPAAAVRLVYEADYTDDIPDPNDDHLAASKWWRAAAVGGDREPTVSFDFDDVLHYAPDGNPIDFWTPASYVPREQYTAELRSLAAGHRVIVVSHRDPGMEDVVYEFARIHGLDIDGVFCVGVRGSKRRILEDEGASVHYDDSPYVESELRESGVELVKVPRTAINDLTWVPDNMWDEFPEIYQAYAERVGVGQP